jgi:hypothetical protein
MVGCAHSTSTGDKFETNLSHHWGWMCLLFLGSILKTKPHSTHYILWLHRLYNPVSLQHQHRKLLGPSSARTGGYSHGYGFPDNFHGCCLDCGASFSSRLSYRCWRCLRGLYNHEDPPSVFRACSTPRVSAVLKILTFWGFPTAVLDFWS